MWKDNIIYYGDGKIQKQLSSYDVVNAINYAIKDDKVKGIILDCSEVNSDLTTLRPIKMALDSFKRSVSLFILIVIIILKLVIT